MKNSAISLLGTALLVLVACGDPFEPPLLPLPSAPGEATLSDFRLGALQSPAAFDLVEVVEVRTDQFSGWDFLYEIDAAGTSTLRPRGHVTDEPSDAGIQQVAESFDGLTAAPLEGYTHDEAVPVQVGDVLAVVSRRDPSFGTVRCRYFAKIEILAVDLTELKMEFKHLVNPNCERLELVPEGE